MLTPPTYGLICWSLIPARSSKNSCGPNASSRLKPASQAGVKRALDTGVPARRCPGRVIAKPRRAVRISATNSLREDVIVAGGFVVVVDYRRHIGAEASRVNIDSTPDAQAITTTAISALPALGLVVADRAGANTNDRGGGEEEAPSEAVAAGTTAAPLAARGFVVVQRAIRDYDDGVSGIQSAAPADAAIATDGDAATAVAAQGLVVAYKTAADGHRWLIGVKKTAEDRAASAAATAATL